MVSDGSKMPVSVTKDVLMDLRDHARFSSCDVVVKRDDEEVYNRRVSKGTTLITLEDQEGFGTVVYEITVDNLYTWEVEVKFTTVTEEETANG